MTAPKIVIVGAGPAGMSAAIALAASGIRPTVVDEAPRRGGQIYREPHPAIIRKDRAIYGFEANRAKSLHRSFDSLGARIDYRPSTAIWDAEHGRLHGVFASEQLTLPWDRLILATGAMDRIIPIPGWTLPGVFTLGAAQTALKSQACAIGSSIVFFGTGPLLYLVAYQYAKAGLDVRAVLDTAPPRSKLRAAPGLWRDAKTAFKGTYYIAQLMARGVSIVTGATPVQIGGGPDGAVAHLVFHDAGGRKRCVDCDAIGFGYGLKSETQLADLLGLAFSFDSQQRQWLPAEDSDGRSSVPGVYLAGDGARVRGVDIAVLTGQRAALTLLRDLGAQTPKEDSQRLGRTILRAAPFRRALDEVAFPYPAHLAAAVDDETIICRCEGITASTLRHAIKTNSADDLNRLKAFTRLGMGRCQGRVCGPPAAEIAASAMGCPLQDVGRLRGQAPIKPVALQALAGALHDGL